MRNFTVKQKTELIIFLADNLPSWSRKEIKQYLVHGSVSVNNQIKTRHDYILKSGDIVSVAKEKESHLKQLLLGFSINLIYEDDDIIVVDKPPGLLTISSENTSTDTLYCKLTNYVRVSAGRRDARIYVVHRLDEDVSGLIVFAKNEKAKNALQSQWETVEKKYYAIVEGCPKEKIGEIKSYLAETKSFRVYSSSCPGRGKLAVTQYKVIKSGPCYALLEVNLITGRKNQIRVHLSEMGCPIIGDKKYGAKTNPARRLGLHAFFISFPHSTKKEKMVFRTEIPKQFNKFIDSWDRLFAGFSPPLHIC